MENFTNFVPKFYQICMFFATAKKLSSDLESPHLPIFSAKCRECKFGKRDGHGKSRNGHMKSHGKVMEKLFVKYVGTLLYSLTCYSWISPPHQASPLSCWLSWPTYASPAQKTGSSLRPTDFRSSSIRWRPW